MSEPEIAGIQAARTALERDIRRLLIDFDAQYEEVDVRDVVVETADVVHKDSARRETLITDVSVKLCLH